ARGRTGDRGGCTLTQPEPGHLVATVEDLPAGHGVSIFADAVADLDAAPALPAPPTDPPEDPGTGLAPPALAAGIAALGGAAATSRLIRRAGRERVGVGGVATARGPAAEGSPPGGLRASARRPERPTPESRP